VANGESNDDSSNAFLGFAEAFGSGIGVGTFFDLSVNFAVIKSVRMYQPNACCGDGMLIENFAFTGRRGSRAGQLGDDDHRLRPGGLRHALPPAQRHRLRHG
jgi:hypothetical protein